MKSDKILLNLVMMLVCFVVLSTAELFSSVEERNSPAENHAWEFDAERIINPDKPFFLDSSVSGSPEKTQSAEFSFRK